MEMKVLTGADVQRLLRVANAIGRGVDEEINEMKSHDLERIIIKIMLAELTLINVMGVFAKNDPVGGLQSFNNLHTSIQQAIMQSHQAGGPSGTTSS